MNNHVFAEIELKISEERFRAVLENPRIEKVGQNLKYDGLIFRRNGIELKGITDDAINVWQVVHKVLFDSP